jgi:L-lactate dehydrogenase complex protein LldG
MNRRDEILGRIKEALRLRAHKPRRAGTSGDGGRTGSTMRAWLPAVPNDHEAIVEAFARNCVELRAQCYRLAGLPELSGKLLELKNSEGWKLIASHRAPILDSILPSMGLPVLLADDRPATADLERADVGITACDALIAQTGSILLTARSAGGRALSVLPPHHIVIARENQLLPDLPAAFELLQKTYGHAYPSLITFITGPSRTGDIERILVLGAHGPRILTIILLRDPRQGEALSEPLTAHT